MKQKGQNLGLLLLQGLDCLTLPSLHLFILCNELVMLSFSSFPYIVFFLQVFWYKFETLLKFFSDKTNKNQPLLSYTFYYVFITSVILSCTSRFFSLQVFPLLFFNFLSFLLFVFGIDCVFWVSAFDLRLLSSNLSVMSSRSRLFSERSSLPTPVPLISSLLFD